jgi:hypothetical protein
VIDAEEEGDKPWLVTIASLANRVGEDQPAMSLDIEGWMSLKWGLLGMVELAVSEPPVYTVAKFLGR